MSHSSTLRARLRRGLCAAAAAAVALSLPTAASAQTPNGPEGLTRVGPVSPSNGYPYWYEDSTGLKLGICTDPANCFFRADPGSPVQFPQTVADAQAGNFNWPDESFYFAAENLEIAALPLRARVMWHAALEGAFGAGDVMPGDQVVFSRIRMRFRGLIPEAQYIVRHPYGEEILYTDTAGDLFETRDLGLAVGDFTGALLGDVGPFLVPTGFDRNAPKGTLLSNAGLTLETVEGSPLGRNYVEYEGPGIGLTFPNLMVDGNPNLIRSHVFSLQGMVAEQYGVGIDDAYYSASGDRTANAMTTDVTVFAQSAQSQNLIARAQNGPWVPMQEVGATGHYFAQISLGSNNSAAPTDLEVRNVSDTPVAIASKAAIPDLITVHDASFTLGADGQSSTLSVDVTSTDRSFSHQVAVDFAGFQVAPLQTGGLGDANFQQPVPATFVPPTEIVVSSQGGGVATYPLRILGPGKSVIEPPTPGPVADAGLDINAQIRTVITLNASGSQGAIAQYMWAPPIQGFEIDALASQGPVLQGTVTIEDQGRVSTDTVVVHVTDPNPISDVINVTVARFDNSRQRWVITGTSNLPWDQRIDVYFAQIVNGVPVKDPNRPIGATFVPDAGIWTYRVDRAALRPQQIPTPGDQFIVVESALRGTATAQIVVTN